ncbi:MAG: class I SAM-dependent methyltransferase [Pseudomonadota bacterium]
MPELNFDAAYYQRFYADQASSAVSSGEQRIQADFVAAYLRYLSIEVDSILDVGCGLGVMLAQLQAAFPRARAQGVEFSAYLCQARGWRQGSVVDYKDEPYDLVVCHDVLGYLSAREATRAIKNLARLTRSALYLSVLTEEDLEICDTERTDMQQAVRPVDWYKSRLEKHFVAVGGGLFLRKPLQHPVWALERADD